MAIVSACTEGVGGRGLMYAHSHSISVGVVLRLDDLGAKKKVVTEVFDHFLADPFIAPYLEGGEVTEYGCHMVAEGGLHTRRGGQSRVEGCQPLWADEDRGPWELCWWGRRILQDHSSKKVRSHVTLGYDTALSLPADVVPQKYPLPISAPHIRPLE